MLSPAAYFADLLMFLRDRNLPDGRVEVVVAGPDDALPELEQLLRAGPANAQVDRVDRAEEAVPISAGKSFDIM